MSGQGTVVELLRLRLNRLLTFMTMFMRWKRGMRWDALLALVVNWMTKTTVWSTTPIKEEINKATMATVSHRKRDFE